MWSGPYPRSHKVQVSSTCIVYNQYLLHRVNILVAVEGLALEVFTYVKNTLACIITISIKDLGLCVYGGGEGGMDSSYYLEYF